MSDVPHIHPLDPYTFGPTQLCFGCGPHNPTGLRLKFERDGDIVRTRFTLGPGYDGPPGLMHGGLQALVADEVAGWTLVGLHGRIGLTTSLQIRYVTGMKLGEEVVAEGKMTGDGISHNGIASIQVTLRQGDQVGSMTRVSFAMADAERINAILPGGMPEGWAKFFGG